MIAFESTTILHFHSFRECCSVVAVVCSQLRVLSSVSRTDYRPPTNSVNAHVPTVWHAVAASIRQLIWRDGCCVGLLE